MKQMVVMCYIAVVLCNQSCAEDWTKVAKDSLDYTVTVTCQKDVLTSVNLGGFFSVPQLKKSEYGGTGFVVSPEGYILTCHHVVDCATSIEVKWSNGASKQAKIHRADKPNDIAILKVDSDKRLRHTQFSLTEPLLAQEVLCLGNAKLEGLSATRGIVSGLDKTVHISETDKFTGLLQTDAAINTGNSGCPAYGKDGKVVGMMVAVWGSAEGMAYMVPAKKLKSRYEALMEEAR
ncbi:MAG: trypsin-like serine protease [Desulfurellales bacterium]|nr:MAG: trypsin-like serine protease [Desulfurellales bacterium]